MSISQFKNNTSDISVVKILLIINILVFVINNVALKDSTPLTNLGTLNIFYFRQGEIWRLITHMFLHGSFFHLLFNMWGLWLFGTSLENTIGKKNFIILYMISGIIGGVFWMLSSSWNEVIYISNDINICKTNYQYFIQNQHSMEFVKIIGGCIGASGAVTGVVLGMALVSPNTRIQLIFPPIPLTLKTFAIGYMILEILLSKGSFSGDNVAHIAHVGGGLTGFIYLLFISFRDPSLYFIRDRIRLFIYRNFDKYVNKFKNKNNNRNFKIYENSHSEPIHNASAEELLAIIRKIDKHGASSLTDKEIALLKQAKNNK